MSLDNKVERQETPYDLSELLGLSHTLRGLKKFHKRTTGEALNYFELSEIYGLTGQQKRYESLRRKYIGMEQEGKHDDKF